MSERLKAIKPCPLCGGDAGHNGDFNFGPDYAYCENSVCQLDGYSIPIDEWQNRPEEDRLTSRNAALVEELARVNGRLDKIKGITSRPIPYRGDPTSQAVKASLFCHLKERMRNIESNTSNDFSCIECAEKEGRLRSIFEVFEEFPIVWRFAKEMIKKLKANRHKTHWDASSVDHMLDRLHEEVAELVDACYGGESGSVTGEGADVANIAMMIVDLADGLDNSPIAILSRRTTDEGGG